MARRWHDTEDVRVEFNQNALDFAASINQNTRDGYQPVSVTRSSSGSTVFYNSVWRLPLGDLATNRISSLACLPDGHAELQIQNESPQDLARFYEILALRTSSDLVDWKPLANLFKTNADPAPVLCLDAEAANHARRFYVIPTHRFITPLLRPTGPYEVGEFSELLTDPGRTNASRRTNMQFMVTCWYPASPNIVGTPAPYMSSRVAAHTSTGFPSSRLADFATHAMEGAPFADDLAHCPVVLYSPSLNSHRRENLMLVQELASHGFVVVGMDHRETMAAEYPDGRVVQGQFVDQSAIANVYARQPERTADARLVMKAAEAWQIAHPLLAGRLDLDNAGAFGFSFGGATAVDFGEPEVRCKAFANIDGRLLNDQLAAAGPTKPFLLLLSDSSTYSTDDNRVLFFQRAMAPAYCLKVAGVVHLSYCELGLLHDLNRFNQLFAQSATTEGLHAHVLARSVVLSFFKRHLRGEEDGVLDQFATNSAAVSLAIRSSGGPVITAAVASKTLVAGQALTLSVAATGQAPLAYRWSLNGAPLPDAAEATLTIPSVSMESAGVYSVAVSDANGTTTCAAPVKILPLRITLPPHRSGLIGGDVTFHGSVQSTPPVDYQWQHDGQDIPGATNASLTLTNLSMDSLGTYSVRASNIYGSQQSRAAQLYLGPYCVEAPQNQIVRAGDTLELSARMLGSLPMHYWWRKSGVTLSRLTRNDLTSSLRFENAQPAQAGLYTLTVTNRTGAAAPSIANTTILVVEPPTDQEGAPGSTVTFAATVSAGGAAVSPGFQWQFGGVNVEGANTGTLVLTNIQPANAGVYTLVVTNNVDLSASFSAVLNVNGN
jgi:dienelactone hydrolase